MSDAPPESDAGETPATPPATPSAGDISAQPVEAAPSCGSCGEGVPASAKRCPHCGAYLDAERRAGALELARACVADPFIPELGPRCPHCGERLPTKEAESSTCTRCGIDPATPEAGKRLVAQAPGWFRELMRGANYLPRGLFTIVANPKLWKFAAVPALLNLVAIGLTVALTGYVIEPWLSDLGGEWAKRGGMWWLLSWGLWALEILAWILLPLLTSWLIVAPPFNIVYKLIFMPVMELMTEATERVILGLEEDGAFEFGRFYANLVVAIIDAILLSFIQLVLQIVLLPFWFVPIVGSLIWAIVPPTIVAGMDYSDINLVRRGYTTREKVRLWKHHQWRFFGYGLAFCFFLTVPFLNAVIIPAAAAGGALLYLELDRK